MARVCLRMPGCWPICLSANGTCLAAGKTLLLSFALSFDDQQLDLSFTEPYFPQSPACRWHRSISPAEQDNDDESNFSQESIGAGVRLGYRLSRNWRQTWGYQLRQDDIQADANASRFILAQDGLSVTSRVSHRLSYDVTNNRFQPSEGIRLTMDNADCRPGRRCQLSFNRSQSRHILSRNGRCCSGNLWQGWGHLSAWMMMSA